MSRTKQPFFPFFLGDLLAATSRWNGQQRSLYVLLLAYQWFGGPIPSDAKEIARMCDYAPEEFDKLWPVVSQKFTPCDGGLINLRCEDHRDKAERISKRRAKSGSKGGKTTKRRAREARQQTEQQDGQQSEQQTEQQTGAVLLPTLLGHPSHPIPSHPNPSKSACGAEEDAPPTFEIDPKAKPEGVMATKLRRAGVIVTSQDLVLHQWLGDGITVERLLEAVGIARITKPREAIPANYLDKIVRDEKRMQAAKPAAEKITWRPPELDGKDDTGT